MITKVIPEQKITLCDACGVECNGDNRSLEGHLKVFQNVLDWYGKPVTGNNRAYDLCDRCMVAVVSAINAAVDTMKPKEKPDANV
jgi:hypothetical protein